MIPFVAIEQGHSTKWRSAATTIVPDPHVQTLTVACLSASMVIWCLMRNREYFFCCGSWTVGSLMNSNLLTSNATVGCENWMVTGPDCNFTVFPSVGKIPCMHLSTHDVLSRSSTASFSTSTNQVHLRRSLMHIYLGMTPSIWIFRRVVVWSCGWFTGFTSAWKFSSREDLLTRFGWGPL